MVLLYLDIRVADQEGIEKFGDEYKAYMQRVPRANFILGLIRYLSSKS
jgi:protein-S-isoprenylcysteine O-methyltransferase Ste14